MKKVLLSLRGGPSSWLVSKVYRSLLVAPYSETKASASGKLRIALHQFAVRRLDSVGPGCKCRLL